MKRALKRWRLAAGASAVLAAGCAGPYDDPTTSTYILGTIFIIIGVAAGVMLIMDLNDG
jgi:hypothetical protein